jgi:ribosomal-protein-alanine N-acetyltransferase
MEIIFANNRDFLEVAALDRAAWTGSSHGEFIPDGEHAWKIWCEHALVIVAKHPTVGIVGAVLAFPCLDGTFCLHKLLIGKEHRGCGLGGKLLGELVHVLDQKNADCFLTVDPSNEIAIGIYRKWGFKEDRFVPGYYRSGEDRWFLVRKCKGSE